MSGLNYYAYYNNSTFKYPGTLDISVFHSFSPDNTGVVYYINDIVLIPSFYAIQYSGFFYAPTTGTYTFTSETLATKKFSTKGKKAAINAKKNIKTNILILVFIIIMNFYFFNTIPLFFTKNYDYHNNQYNNYYCANYQNKHP